MLLAIDELLFRRIFTKNLSGFLEVFRSVSFILLEGEISVFKIASLFLALTFSCLFSFFTGVSVGKMSFDQFEEHESKVTGTRGMSLLNLIFSPIHILIAIEN